ncbi:MAG: FadR/GntR family transcriptional regulator [Pseudomonadota bacterium]
MPYEKIQSEKLSHSIVEQIELLILRGILEPGERLPSERDLSERMGVSRPSLREAIAELEGKGLLNSKRGAGIFVASDLRATFHPALLDLFSTHVEADFDYIALRRDLESIAIKRAIRHGSDTDLKIVDTVFERLRAADLAGDYEKAAELDALFHLTIIEAGHNSVLLHMMRALMAVFRTGVFRSRDIAFRQMVSATVFVDLHKSMNDALQARDLNAAEVAVNKHFDFVEETLVADGVANKNELIARKRFNHVLRGSYALTPEERAARDAGDTSFG